MAANYPSWVMKYKGPGIYVNKSGNNYYLYRGHCEYRNGKNVRVVDEYLGRVTEKDGLIPSKGNVREEVRVYEYGLFYFLFLLFDNIYKGQKRLNGKYADTIMVCAIRSVLDIPEAKMPYTALFFLYSDYSDRKREKVEPSEVERVSRMMKDYMARADVGPEEMNILSTLFLVVINKKKHLSACDRRVAEIFRRNKKEVRIHGQG